MARYNNYKQIQKNTIFYIDIQIHIWNNNLGKLKRGSDEVKCLTTFLTAIILFKFEAVNK